MGDIDPVQGVVNVVDRVDAGGTTQLRGLLYLGGNPMGLKPETATIKTLASPSSPPRCVASPPRSTGSTSTTATASSRPAMT